MAGDKGHDAAAPDPEEGLADRIGETTRRQELEDPDSGLGALDRAVNRLVELLGVGVLVAIVATIFVNAAGRYLWNKSLPGAEELVLLLMPWLAILGTFLAVRRGTMIRIEYFYEHLPVSMRRPVALTGYILCVIMLVFLGVVSTRLVILSGSYPTTYLGIPTGWSIAALAIGGFGVAIAFFAILLRELAAAYRGDGSAS